MPCFRKPAGQSRSLTCASFLAQVMLLSCKRPVTTEVAAAHGCMARLCKISCRHKELLEPLFKRTRHDVFMAGFMPQLVDLSTQGQLLAHIAFHGQWEGASGSLSSWPEGLVLPFMSIVVFYRMRKISSPGWFIDCRAGKIRIS